MTLPRWRQIRAICFVLWAAAAILDSAGSHANDVRFVLDDNRILVTGQVEASGRSVPARIWIDNGNPDIWITSALARALGLSRIGPVRHTLNGNAYLAGRPSGMVIAGTRLDIPAGTRVVALETPFIGPGIPANINVPTTAWAGKDLRIDYGRSVLAIGMGVAAHRGFPVRIQIDPATNLVRLPATIDGVTYLAGLDIGATYSFFDRRLIDSLHAAHPRWPYLAGSVGAANIWGWPGEETAPLLRMPRLRWGTLDLYQLGVAPLPPAFPEPLRKGDLIGVIGGDLLKHATLEIDYPGSIAYFDGTSYTDDDKLLTIGLTLEPTPSGRYLVRGVIRKGGGATVAGVRPHDRLVAVNGEPVSGRTMGAVLMALAGRDGEVKRLTMERNGRQFDVLAHVTELLAATRRQPPGRRQHALRYP